MPTPRPMRSPLSRAALTVLLTAGLASTGAARASVQVETGPTPIPGGAARKSGDITLRNSRLAVAIAVETAPPYGVPPGSIVDAAPVVDGEIAGSGDTLTQVDLIPDNWSAWPNTYHRVTVTKNTPDRAVVTVERDFGHVAMTTTYTLDHGSDEVHMVTDMVNNGDESLDLLSGYVLWERSGSFFGIPGLVASPQSGEAIPESGPADRATGSWNALYAEDWAFSVHMPGFDRYDYSGRDLYVSHTLEPGGKRTLEGWFQVAPRGDLSEMVRAEAERRQLDTGRIRGHVTTAGGDAVARPVVVVFRGDRPYAWTIGESDGDYRISLPSGDYELYATAKAHSSSPTATLSIGSDETVEHDFSGLGEPGRMKLTVTDDEGHPLDARISIAEGTTPLVGFLGKSTFFTNAANPIGQAAFPIAPGSYRFAVSAGSGFVSSRGTTDEVTIAANKTAEAGVAVTVALDPNRKDWYAADTHHHSLAAEGVTPPVDLFRSQMAERLDLILVSDHDSLDYLDKAREYAEKRDVPFIPSIEVSASWGHFNPMPVNMDGPLPVDSGTATVDEIFEAARESGASVIQANHPSNAYGYLNNVDKGVVPGGFNPDFDLAEINAGYIESDWAEAVDLWNRHLAGELKRVYALGAGSDVHDVRSARSGRMRLYAHVPGELSTASYLAASKAGHAYATGGPIIYPKTAGGEDEPVLFGKSYRLPSASTGDTSAFTFTVDLRAMDGLKTVTVISEGKTVQTVDLGDRGRRADDVAFSLEPDGATWYALKVTDGDDDVAYTNPFWIER